LTETTKTAYLDTSILANWMLLYRRKRKGRRVKPPTYAKHARQCMTLLSEIEHRKYSCRLITSTYAFAELGQSARDSRTAVKIIRDGLSLNWYNRLKKRYPLRRKEQTDIMRSIESFHNFLERLGIEIMEPIITQQDVNQIALKHSLEVNDATHVVIAKWAKVDFLITADQDFLECKPKIRKPEVMVPPTLATRPELRRR